MDTRHYCNSSSPWYSLSPVGEYAAPEISLPTRVAMRMSRARWFIFLRRVYRYQNGSRSDLLLNPFNSGPWLAMELVLLLVQISVITAAIIAVPSRKYYKPAAWHLAIWLAGYNLGNILSLPLLYWRFRYSKLRHPSTTGSSSGSGSCLEQQIETSSCMESRSSYLMNRSRTFLELYMAILFVIGTVWIFDTRYKSSTRSPELHMLCVILLAGNAIAYSFPFLVFLLLCCCVPLVHRVLGFNMNAASKNRGASNDQISRLPRWMFKEAHMIKNELAIQNSDCRICLSKYKDQEQVTQLPCLHVFHLGCADQWLRIISCCPLCKQGIDK